MFGINLRIARLIPTLVDELCFHLYFKHNANGLILRQSIHSAIKAILKGYYHRTNEVMIY